MTGEWIKTAKKEFQSAVDSFNLQVEICEKLVSCLGVEPLRLINHKTSDGVRFIELEYNDHKVSVDVYTDSQIVLHDLSQYDFEQRTFINIDDAVVNLRYLLFGPTIPF